MIVTGGGTGIGESIACEFAARGLVHRSQSLTFSGSSCGLCRDLR
jgi:short-subunit dehydrogenase